MNLMKSEEANTMKELTDRISKHSEQISELVVSSMSGLQATNLDHGTQILSSRVISLEILYSMEEECNAK